MNELKTCLLLILLVGYFLAGSCQCEIKNLRNSYTPSSLLNSEIEWDCDQPNTIFTVTFQLINAGMCNTKNGTEYAVYTWGDITRTSFRPTIRDDEFHAYASKLVPNSTYLLNVQPKIWEAGTGYIYGSPHNEGITIDTDEDIYLDFYIRDVKYNSFAIKWRYIYPDCAEPEIEYELYRDHDGRLIRSNRTAAIGKQITLSNLECDTSYRLHFVYRTNTDIVTDTWYTSSVYQDVKTTTDIQRPSIVLVDVTENSFNFTWNTYQHCNDRSTITAVYEYELYRDHDGVMIDSGSDVNTNVAFGQLTPDTDYRFRVRVSVSVDRVNSSSRTGYWAQILSRTSPAVITTNKPVVASTIPATLPTTAVGLENCEIRNFRVEDDGDYISLFWNQGLGCQRPEDELYVTYRLLKSTMCDSGNESNFPSFQLPLKSLTMDDRRQYNLKFSKAHDLTLYANSTYEFTVQIIEWRPWTGYVYTLDWLQPGDYMSGSRQQAYLQTPEGIYFFDQSITSDSISLSWSPYLDCANAMYEYRLYKDSTGYLVSDTSTSKRGLEIVGLECGTRYRLVVSYKTKKGSGGEEWLFYKTKQIKPPMLIIVLTAATESTLNFSWDKYKHCNQEIVNIEYEYELLRADTNTQVYQESQTSTFLSFNHLASKTLYVLQVRVSTFETAKGVSRFSKWSSFNAMTSVL